MIRDKNKLKNIEEANKKLESTWLDNKIVEGRKKDIKKYLKGEYPDQDTRDSEYDRLVTPHQNKLGKFSKKKIEKLFDKRFPEGEDLDTTQDKESKRTFEAVRGEIEKKYGQKLRTLFQTEVDLLEKINEEFSEDGVDFFYELKQQFEDLYNQDGVDDGKISAEEWPEYEKMLKK